MKTPKKTFVGLFLLYLKKAKLSHTNSDLKTMTFPSWQAMTATKKEKKDHLVFKFS